MITVTSNLLTVIAISLGITNGLLLIIASGIWCIVFSGVKHRKGTEEDHE
jgi:hypothetical protein